MTTGWKVGGSNPGENKIFRTCPDRPWGPPSLPYNGYRVFPGAKDWPARDADPSPPSSAVGHERIELYFYSPYGPYGLYRASVPVQGCILPLPLPYDWFCSFVGLNTIYSVFCTIWIILKCRSCVSRLTLSKTKPNSKSFSDNVSESVCLSWFRVRLRSHDLILCLKSEDKICFVLLCRHFWQANRKTVDRLSILVTFPCNHIEIVRFP